MLYIDEESQIIRVIIEEDINVFNVSLNNQLNPSYTVEFTNIENTSDSNKYKQFEFDLSNFKYSGLYNMAIYGGSPLQKLRVDLLTVIKNEVEKPTTYKKNNTKF